MAELAEKTEAASPPGEAAGTPAVKTVELTKRFGHTVALAGLSMTVPRGEVFGFLGPNGAGKTTAVKLLLGLLKPTSGQGYRRPSHAAPDRLPARALSLPGLAVRS